jgi:hypothetical protein
MPLATQSIIPAPRDSGLPTPQQRDTAQYVADMILELRNMAKAVKLHTIAAPLEYAYYEAFSVANAVAVPVAEIERLKQLSRAAEADYKE